MPENRRIVSFKRLSIIVGCCFLLLASVTKAAENNRRVRELIAMALGGFNPTVPQNLQLREVEYVRKYLLGSEYSKKLLEADRRSFPNQEAKAAAIQEMIAGLMPVCFVTLRDNTTFWSSMARNQEIKFPEYFSGVRGTVKGKAFTMSLEQMRRELKSLEFPLDYSGGAIAFRRDGTSFSIGSAELYAEENDGSWYCIYSYELQGKVQRKLIFGSDDYSPNWRVLRRITFGLQVPKMNQRTDQVFPGDYKYDPFTRESLVPVEWSGAVHIPK